MIPHGNGHAPTLPQPRRERWQPLRAGLVDLFFYDAEEFWFRDGHLLLRGNNGTGKSKVLALLLPYLLDGDHRAQRVEPDGDPNKRMEWNLLLGGRYSDRLGYAWVEFGRRDADGTVHTVTLGCGMKAVVGKGVATKWFFVTDLRMGAGLTLVDSAGLVLSRERLREALGNRGELFDRVESYRRAVDERLFHLGPDRYDTLVTLLIQLRQPQLSKRPNERALSDALTRALPPLPDAVINDVADAFHALEEERDELAALVEARRAVDAFRGRYRRYAAIATRRRAAVVRKAQSAYETINRRLSSADDAVNVAEQRERTIRAQRDQTTADLQRARVEERTLRESPQMRDLQRLEAAAAAAQRAGEAAQDAQRELGDARDDADRRREEHARRVSDTDHAALEQAQWMEQVVEAAEAAGIGADHATLVADVVADTDAPLPRDRTLALAGRRDEAVRHVRELAARTADAARDQAEARRAFDAAATQRDAVVEELSAAEAAASRAGDDLLAAFERYIGEATELHIDDLTAVGTALAEWVTALAGDNPATTAVHQAAREAAGLLARDDARLVAERDEVSTEIANVTAERERLETGVHVPPPTPHTRDPAVRATRRGAPLWQLVDFTDGVDAADRASLEAALEAGGLLDGWVTPDGSLLSAGTHDVVVTAGQPVEASLTAALRPAIDRDDAAVSADVVAAVLAGIGLGPATADTWVAHDGRFRVGVLEGAWSKPQADHIGHAAREQARRRRLAELDEIETRLRERIDRLDRQRALIAERRASLDADVRRLPPDDRVREAVGTVAALTTQLRHAEERVIVAQDRLDVAQQALARAVTVRDTAAAELALPVDTAGLDTVAHAVTEYRVGLASLWPAIAAARTAALAQRRAEADAARAETLVKRRADRLATLARDARETAQVHATLQETVGAAASELAARLEAVTTRVGALEGTVEQRTEELQHAAAHAGEARGAAAQLRVQLDEHAAVRLDATDALRRFAETSLISAALGDDAAVELPDPAEPWAPDPTVRLARRLDQVLDDVDASDDAWDRAANTLMHHLADLQRVLAVHGHHAAGDQRDEVWVVTIQFRSNTVTPDALAQHLAEDVAYHERVLDAKEREVLEEHLVTEAASQLTALISDAEQRVGRMNAELAARPTSTGMALRMRWVSAADAPAGLAEARRRLLRQAVDAWSPDDRRAIGDFLKAQIDAVRAANEAATWREHLAIALDYRRWHRFVIERKTDGNWRSATGPASGGERVLTVTVPLFAAASAYYETAHQHAPRLVLLDEAFAGVDDDARAKCLGLLESFDLDYVLTSEREWGCYPTVPGLAICQLVRRDGIDAVHISRWEWDGNTPRKVDDPPRSAMAVVAGGDGVLSASGGSGDDGGPPSLFGDHV